MTFDDFSSAVYGAFKAYDLGSFSCDPSELRAIFDAVRGGKVVAELGPYSSCAVSITDEVILEGTELIENQLDELVTVPGKRYRIQLIELPEGSDG